MRVTGSYGNLLQGVSQQPLTIRSSGQATEQINFYPDPVSGLTRFPPMVRQALLSGMDSVTHNDKLVSFFVRDEVNTVFVLTLWKQASGWVIRMHDMKGNAVPVAYYGPAADIAAYLTSDDINDFSVASYGKNLYVLNRKTVVKEVGGDTAATPNNWGCINIRIGENTRMYTVNAGTAVIAQHTTPSLQNDSNLGPNIIAASPNSIATAISGLLTTWATDNGITIYVVNSCLFLQAHNETQQKLLGTITVSSNAGDLAVNYVYDTIGSPTYLPPCWPSDFPQVIVSKKSLGDSLYYQTTGHDSSITTVNSVKFYSKTLWTECAPLEARSGPDPKTMPLVGQWVVKDSVRTFTIGPLDSKAGNVDTWSVRAAGDAKACAAPHFIGYGINDITFFQGRMVILSGDTMSMSRSELPFNFYRTSPSALEDDDPIELANPGDKSYNLLHAAPHGRDLELIASKAQFTLPGNAMLTPKTAVIYPGIAEDATDTAKPVTVSKFMYFTSFDGVCSQVSALTDSTDFYGKDSKVITQHIKKYLKGKIIEIEGDASVGTVYFLSENRKTIYCFKFAIADQGVVQAAWFQRTLSDDRRVISMRAELGVLNIVTARSYGGVGIETVTFTNSVDDGFPYIIHLDDKHKVATGADITVPPGYVVIQGAGCPLPGDDVPVVDGKPDWTVVAGAAATCYVGRKYMSTYMPSMPMARDQNGKANTTDRFIVSSITALLRQSGFVSADVKVRNGVPLYTANFPGLIASANNTTLFGQLPVYDLPMTITVRDTPQSSSVSIYTDAITPCTIENLEWTGQFSPKGRRMS